MIDVSFEATIPSISTTWRIVNRESPGGERETRKRNESPATYPRPLLLLIEWLRRRRSTGDAEKKHEETGRERALPRARHLISEIPNIFKSTGAGCSAREEEEQEEEGSRGAVVSPRPQRRTSLSTAIKIRIIIIRATAE